MSTRVALQALDLNDIELEHFLGQAYGHDNDRHPFPCNELALAFYLELGPSDFYKRLAEYKRDWL